MGIAVGALVLALVTFGVGVVLWQSSNSEEVVSVHAKAYDDFEEEQITQEERCLEFGVSHDKQWTIELEKPLIKETITDKNIQVKNAKGERYDATGRCY
ncbi:hypothetical protein [Halobacillus sp. Nhm2S1]|uniref:hypothetical protein n=1 Tax=Halobacillus sp. Nhm2S1 TaxID=2866716 RepID=UPI001C72F744|nr:hypothetical protein [Halobacillus sp. Nhm2S1]MBX0359542.1 hypothetical protein [Halobacillus sp. Nhm2S1]